MVFPNSKTVWQVRPRDLSRAAHFLKAITLFT
jgi:hypothetical protein